MAAKTALLVIDVQEGLSDSALGNRNNPRAEEKIASLLAAWRNCGKPVIHVRHCSIDPDSLLRPGLPGNEIKAEAKPVAGEKVFSKNTNSAFIGTGLEDYLRQENIGALIVVGFTTDHCISTSVRMAANLGFAVTLVSDATATHDRLSSDGVRYAAEQIHEINLLSLDREFCKLDTASELLEKIDRGYDFQSSTI